MFDNAMAARDAKHFKEQDRLEDNANAVNAEARLIIEAMADGKGVSIGGYSFEPEGLIRKLLGSGCDASNILILAFSGDKGARVTAHDELLPVIEEWAQENVDFKAEEARNDY